jgi:hypothetical protein
MANLILGTTGTPVAWTDSTGDLAMTLNNLAAGAGRQGAIKSFGTADKANRYMWRAFVQFATAPVVGESVEIYLKTSDGTHPDNDDGTGDIAVSAEDKLKNLMYIGSIIVDEAATGVKMVAQGFIDNLDVDNVMPIFFNQTADNLVATDNLNGFIITPMPFEIQ